MDQQGNLYPLVTVSTATADPVYDLITLADVKTELGITDTSQDSALSAQITLWSKIIADYCGRVFALETVTETFHMKGQRGFRPELHKYLYLRRYPVVGDVTITLDDVDVDATTFVVEPDCGIIKRLSQHWYGKIIVTHAGGYDLPDAAPAMLARACVEMVKINRLTQARDPSVRSVQHGDTNVSYFAPISGDVMLPSNVLGMIEPYKYIAA